MSRFTGPKGKIVRRLGVNIYGNPKFDKLLEKRPNPPGFHGPKKARRQKMSEYGTQLAEKQKLKYTYGMRERGFRVLFKRALRKDGITGDNLMVLLETRLDNAVYRLRLAPTRDAARQMILHGHLKVNDRRVNVPSFHVRPGDVITVKSSVKSETLVKRNIEAASRGEAVEWATLDKDGLKGTIDRYPTRDEIPNIANEQLVVELYSK